MSGAGYCGWAGKDLLCACVLKHMLDLHEFVVIVYNMKADLIFRERETLDAGRLIEQVIWRVPQPVPPCKHPYKYRLAYIVNGVRVVGYDDERGKGDHRHFGEDETEYVFCDVRTLMADFVADMMRWDDGYGHS